MSAKVGGLHADPLILLIVNQRRNLRGREVGQEWHSGQV